MCHIFIHSSVDGHLGCFWQVILTFLPLIRIQFRIISFLKNFIYLLFIFGCVGSSFLCDAFLQLRQAGATPHRAARASHYRGLSCCGAQAPDAQAQQSWLTGPAAPWHVGSSQTRARNRVPCIGRQTLNHCAIREAPHFFFLNWSIVVLISGVERSDSVIHVVFQFFYSIGLQDIEYSSLCFTVNPCYLFIYIKCVYINPNLLIYLYPPPFPFDNHVCFLYQSLFWSINMFICIL